MYTMWYERVSSWYEKTLVRKTWYSSKLEGLDSKLECLDSKLERLDSQLECLEFRHSSFKDQGSRQVVRVSSDCQLTFDRYCKCELLKFLTQKFTV